MRADLLGSFVQSVEITEKENVTLELLPKSHSLDSCSNGFALKSEMGAAREVSAINPALTAPMFPPVELDYDIIRPRRVGRRAVMVAHSAAG